MEEAGLTARRGIALLWHEADADHPPLKGLVVKYPLRYGRALLALATSTLVLAAACADEDEPTNGDPGTPETGTPVAGAPPTEEGTGTPEATETSVAAGPTLTDESLAIEAIEGFDMPTQIAFLGEGEALVTEKTGAIVHVRDGEIVGDAISLAANYADERGVLGITLHPDFTENNYVYVYWTWNGEGTPPEGLVGEATDDLEQVPENGNRVDRFTWDGSQLEFDQNIVELPSYTTDLTMDRRRGNHDGGVIKFGPDGALYIVNGDHNVRGELTNVADGPSIEESGLVAVLLRLNDDGTIPDDNPFASLGDPASAIYAYGIRNSFGFDFDPDGGRLWLEVNGQASYDTLGWYEAGDNLGWIQLMGPPERFEDYKALELDTERLLDNPEFPPDQLAGTAEEAQERLFLLEGATYRPPLFSWQRAVGLTDVEFIERSGLGDDYEGDLLLGDVNTGTVYRLELTDDRQGLVLEGELEDGVNDNFEGDVLGELSDEQIFGQGFAVVTDIASAPDGSLWIASHVEGTIYRVTAE